MAFTPIFGTGFEMGTLNFAGSSTYGSVSATTGAYKTGTYSLGLGDRSYWTYTLPTPQNEIYFSVWYNSNLVNTNGNCSSINIYLSDGTYLTITFSAVKPTYYINGTAIATGNIGNATNWQNYKVHVKVADSGGIFQVKIDGVTDLDYSGDTKPSTGTTVASIRMYSGWNDTTYVDDFVVGTGGEPLDYRFVRLVPTADTAQADFTCSSGSTHYSLVDEVPPSATDYVYSSTNGYRDLYDITDFAATGGVDTYTPQFVVQWAQAWKSNANNQSLKLLQKLGSTVYSSASMALTTSAYNYYDLKTTNPDGGEWTDANLDNLQIGQESVV